MTIIPFHFVETREGAKFCEQLTKAGMKQRVMTARFTLPAVIALRSIPAFCY